MLKENSCSSSFFANGKLLLTSEYLVLDGAKAFAIPTKKGQSLHVEITEKNDSIHWLAIDCENNIWHEEYISETILLKNIHEITNEVSRFIAQIFQYIESINSGFFKKNIGTKLHFKLDFPRNWGLGTSSTLVSLISQWANIDPYLLLKNTFGGSGYDIACASATSAIEFKNSNHSQSIVPQVFAPNFLNHLYFVYLEKKQNSRSGIEHYRSKKPPTSLEINQMNEIAETLFFATTLEIFEKAIEKHEAFIARFINMEPVKNKIFPDFWGAIKSLGAWGGDFVLATSSKDDATTKDYFSSKGYHTILLFSELV